MIDELEQRVKAMEEAYDRSLAILARLQEDLDAFEGNAGTMKELAAYMDSGLWRQDFEADEAGLLPPGLKRGVLSEDGLFDLLARYGEMRRRLAKIGKKPGH